MPLWAIILIAIVVLIIVLMVMNGDIAELLAAIFDCIGDILEAVFSNIHH